MPYALHAKTAENLSGINTGDQDLSGLATISSVNSSLATKVDKVNGKGLSTNLIHFFQHQTLFLGKSF